MDSGLKKTVLTAEKPSGFHIHSLTNLTGGFEARLIVRLRTVEAPSVIALLSLGRKDATEPGYQFLLQSAADNDQINCSVSRNHRELHNVAALSSNTDWNVGVYNNMNNFYYRLRSQPQILPGWPEDYRILAAKDMAELPDHNAEWLDLRVNFQPGHLRVWVDDRLVAHKRDDSVNPDGFARLDLSPGVQLASFSIVPVAPGSEPRGFVPIRLAGYANARALFGKEPVKPESLPPPDQVTSIGGVPFIFPGINMEGNDHIDVGRSLLREAHLEGYHPANEARFIGSCWRDPARIQLRIPYRAYDRLYLVCAADDDREAIPLVAASFYRPFAGFAEFFEATNVPPATAQSSSVTPIPITLGNGRKANLWLVTIPLDPGRLFSFSDLDTFEVELTKKIHQYRSYPDPISYGWHQGGRPSAVHVYAATLGEAPVTFEFKPDKFGHVWTEPEVPGYTAVFANQTGQARQGTLTVATRSYDGSETNRQEQSFTVPAGQTQSVKLSLPVKRYGYHDVVATARLGDRTWEEKRSLARLAPDTRSPRWEAGKGALFGYWSYYGGHHTPKPELQVNLMTAAGARGSIPGGDDVYKLKNVKEHFSAFPDGAWKVQVQPWAWEEPVNQQKYNEFKQSIAKVYAEAWEKIPPEFRPDHVFFFPEPHVSLRLTTGNYPEYWGGTPYEYTQDEKNAMRAFTVTAKAAAEAIREKWPSLKVLIPWGDPLFIVPFLRAGTLKGLLDGSGLDICGFERLPEQQLHQISLHRLYQLKNEYAKAGISNPTLIYCEGIFVPTEVGACSWREQMDIYSRWNLISMAYGVTRFYASWSVFDAASYYGAEHYACAGIMRRIPYCDPKPSYAAYATLTERLNQAHFDGWLKTGSLSTYALRFKGPRGNVYTLWTIRGKRPVTLTLAADAAVQVTDAMNNTRIVNSKDRKLTVTTDPSVSYLTGAGDITAVEPGTPDHADAAPAVHAVQVADLGDGTWTFTSARDKSYEENGFGIARFPGKFSAQVAQDAEQGNVLVSRLEKQDKVHELMPWYNILAPKKPVKLPGVPAAIGLWAKGNSDWGRVIYVLRDAKGERCVSIGAKDDWNCDDLHSWCSFNFDGWRYLRFELPGNLEYDSYRKPGATWWLFEHGDKIVDLPLTLEQIIVEQRSHILYVNDVQPAATNSVAFGKLFVEYEQPGDAAEEAVKVNHLRMEMPADNPNLPNPIRDMIAAGVGAPAKIAKLQPPTHYYDGTRMHVFFEGAPGTNTYQLWVSAYSDGRGAVNLTPNGLKNGDLVYNLRPGIKLYFWVAYRDAQGRTSKPSPVYEAVLKDEFKEK